VNSIFSCELLDIGRISCGISQTACMCIPYTVVAVANVCHFPAYLRRATSSTSATSDSSAGQTGTAPGDSQWVTELRYSTMTAQIQSRLDIIVFDTELMAKVSFAVQCQQSESSSAEETQSCYQTELVYRRSCVDRMSDDKFKVLHNEGL